MIHQVNTPLLKKNNYNSVLLRSNNNKEERIIHLCMILYVCLPFILIYNYPHEYYDNNPKWVQPIIICSMFNPISFIPMTLILLNINTKYKQYDHINQIKNECLHNIQKYNITFTECTNLTFDNLNFYKDDCIIEFNLNAEIYKNINFNCKNMNKIMCEIIIKNYNITYNKCNDISEYCLKQLKYNKLLLKNIKFECIY